MEITIFLELFLIVVLFFVWVLYVKVLLFFKLCFALTLAGEVTWEAAFFLLGTNKLLLMSLFDEEDTLFLSPKGVALET